MKQPCAKIGHVWLVVFIAGLDSSTGGEQCAIHIVLHPESPVMPVNERKMAFLIFWAKLLLLIFDVMCPHILMKREHPWV